MPRTKEAFQQIRDESRQHILGEAARVFAQKGVANTKISDLARAAGVSQGLIYRYFSDKDEIFIALLDRAIDGVIFYAQTIHAQNGTPIERLHRLTEHVIRGMGEEPVYFQLFAQAMALSGRVYETLTKLDALVKILRALIIEGQSRGEIVQRDPDQLIFLYLGCLFGLAAGKGLNLGWLEAHFPVTEEVLRIFSPQAFPSPNH